MFFFATITPNLDVSRAVDTLKTVPAEAEARRVELSNTQE